jgi:hypothetical protein
MPIKKFNPPFTNLTIADFFEFECDSRRFAVFIRDWLSDNFPDLVCSLHYHVPFYTLDSASTFYYGSKLFYLHYFKTADGLELEISFVNGSDIVDKYKLFQSKNKQTKSIIIDKVTDTFLERLKYYVDSSINIATKT